MVCRSRPRVEPAGWFAAGVTLPDLRGHTRAARLSRTALETARPRTERERALQAGLLEHERADAAFHASPAFAAWRRALRPAAAALGLRGATATLVIHVGVEVALDRCLLLDEPGLADALYAELEEVDSGDLAAALVELAGEPSRPLATTFQLFQERRHLTAWTERSRAAASLARVCEGVLGARGRGPLPDPVALEGFLARAEEALVGSDYAPTAIAAWLGAASGESAGAA